MIQRKAAGFTLVELSIVLVIIGLIVGGIVGGKSLIKAARISKVTTQVQTYKTAIRIFEDQYDYLPGDFPEAWDYWGNNCYASSSTSYQNSYCNGNGDGLIAKPQGEQWKVWEHLTLAKIIPGSYEGAAWMPPTKPGINVPRGPISGSIFTIASPGYGQEYFYKKKGTMLYFDGLTERVLTSQDAHKIDKKFDDGKSSTGEIFSYGSYYGANDCVTNGYTSVSTSYVLSSSGASCRMGFWLKHTN